MLLNNKPTGPCSFVAFPHLTNIISSQVTMVISVDLEVVSIHLCTIRCKIILYIYFFLKGSEGEIHLMVQTIW